MLIYSSWSFGFLYGLYVPYNKLNVKSKKLTICKFVFISILKPPSLKISIVAFRIRSVFSLDVFHKSTRWIWEANMKMGTWKSSKRKRLQNFTLNYTYKKDIKEKRNRSRNIIWFNPPFNKNVSTNVAKQFLNLIDEHFPKSNKLHAIFNRNAVKVSYSCT